VSARWSKGGLQYPQTTCESAGICSHMFISERICPYFKPQGLGSLCRRLVPTGRGTSTSDFNHFLRVGDIGVGFLAVI
jgi:hypothetical protein